MSRLAYDLHIHSCLSPCGDEDMTPANIVGMAAIKKLDVIAVTDHNSCRNCKAAAAWGEQYDVIVIPGMELTTVEDVHVLCLFESIEQALAFDSYVYGHLNKQKNSPLVFGAQSICDEKDVVIGEEEMLLIQSTTLSFDKIYDLMERFEGVMIPAHIDKNSNSLLYNLGFVPENSRFRTVEIADLTKEKQIMEEQEYLRECLVISNSDAHYLKDINEPQNYMEVPKKSIGDVMDWLRNISN